MTTKIGFNFYLPLAQEYVPVITPARKEPEHPTNDIKDHPEFLTLQTLNALHNVIDNAVLYLDGERAQDSLFKDEK